MLESFYFCYDSESSACHSSSIYFSLYASTIHGFYLSAFMYFFSLSLSFTICFPCVCVCVFAFVFGEWWYNTTQAYKLGMFGADYVWILHEIVGEPWWHKTTHECSQKQLQEVSENLLIVSSHNSIVSNEISYSGLVSILSLSLYLFFFFMYANSWNDFIYFPLAI